MTRPLSSLLGLSLVIAAAATAACSSMDIGSSDRHNGGDDPSKGGTLNPDGTPKDPSATNPDGTPKDTTKNPDGTALETDPFKGLAVGSNQLAIVCARGAHDKVAQKLCATPAPSIGSLADLLKTLDLDFKDTSGTALNGAGGNPAFALLAHSTSLITRSVSAANPRAIIMSAPAAWAIPSSIALDSNTGMAPPNGWNPPSTPDQSSWSQPSNWTPPTATQTLASWPPGLPGQWGGPSTPVSQVDSTASDSGYVVLSYARGENFVELAAHDATTGKINLYLLKYDAACSGRLCKDGELYTPKSEQGWSNLTVYGDKDLENTIVDCTHCHQPGGSAAGNILRMQEMADPWTHWMSPWTAGGEALVGDFQKVHGTSESYAGIPAALIGKSEPRTLELLVRNNGFAVQPNAFAGRDIEIEVHASAPMQPVDNSQIGASSTWQAAYAAGATGQFIAAPHHDVKIADATKLQAAATQYAGYLATGDASTAPMLKDLYSDLSAVAMGLTPSFEASGSQILAQTCVECHNGNVDKSITRSHFDATNLGAMTQIEKDLAIARLKMSPDDVRHMPPARSKVLTAGQATQLEGLLK